MVAFRIGQSPVDKVVQDVKRELAVGKDRVLARLADNPHRRLITDTVAEMGWWACFQEKDATPALVPSQPKPATPKTGRNEPCPCRSGKKYKKCCGA